MITVRDIRLSESDCLVLREGSSDSELELRCRLSERLNPAALVVESGGRVVAEVPRFVPLVLKHADPKGGEFEGELKAVVEDDEPGFAFLFGDQEIVRLGFSSRNLDPVCKLNRRVDDDRGFYSLSVELLPDSFLVVYEGGAVRIRLSGEEMWHDKLAWDDVFEKRDDDHLYYNTEHGEFAQLGFRIDIATGETLSR